MLPSILNDSTSFWLDFAGSRLPETSESKKNCVWKFLSFLILKKNVEDRFFQISGSILTSVLEPGAAKKCDIRYSIFLFFFWKGLFLNSGSLSLSKDAFSHFGLAFSLQNHVFYDGVFQNLAFRSRMKPKVPQTCWKSYLKWSPFWCGCGTLVEIFLFLSFVTGAMCM